MGILSLDMAKFYIENEHLNFDIKNITLPILTSTRIPFTAITFISSSCFIMLRA